MNLNNKETKKGSMYTNVIIVLIVILLIALLAVSIIYIYSQKNEEKSKDEISSNENYTSNDYITEDDLALFEAGTITKDEFYMYYLFLKNNLIKQGVSIEEIPIRVIYKAVAEEVVYNNAISEGIYLTTEEKKEINNIFSDGNIDESYKNDDKVNINVYKEIYARERVIEKYVNKLENDSNSDVDKYVSELVNDIGLRMNYERIYKYLCDIDYNTYSNL